MIRTLLHYAKMAAETAWYPVFLAGGRRPWTLGYGHHKRREIRRAIETGCFNQGNLATGYGFRLDERIVEYPWLFSRLPSGRALLLDAGAALNHRLLVTREPLKSKTLFISTLSPEHGCLWRRGISYVFQDLRSTCFRDGIFDIIVCISTIEHIGCDNTMLYTADPSKKEHAPDSYLIVARELRRVLRPNGALFLSFPFGKRAHHGWFQVFSSDMVDRLLDAFSPASVQELYFGYAPTGWRKASREELRDATFFDIQTQKTYDPDFAAGARGLACLEMVK